MRRHLAGLMAAAILLAPAAAGLGIALLVLLVVVLL